jgi:hypothetical protein
MLIFARDVSTDGALNMIKILQVAISLSVRSFHLKRLIFKQ